MDGGSLLTDVADLRRLADQVEGSTCMQTAEAVAAGTIGLGQAQVIAKVITDLPSALPEDVWVAGEAKLVAHAAALNPAELARAGRYFACHVDPRGVARDDAEQRSRSGITFASTLYGAGIARGDLDPGSLAVISAALEPLYANNPPTSAAPART